MTHISIIAAIQKQDRAMGKDNALLWKISPDLKRFKELTSGHPIIMGRKTHESIGRPLPNRTNIIITRNADYKVDGCIVVSSLEQALNEAKKVEQQEIFIIGGSEIYRLAISLATKLYLTIVDDTQSADVYFPDYYEFTQEVFREDHPESTPSYSFVNLIK